MSAAKIEFSYRKIIKKIYWALVILSILALLIIFRVNIAKWSTESYLGTTIKMIMVSIVPLSILFRLHFFIRPFIFSKYQLEQGKLKIKFGRKEKTINLDNVKSLSFTLFSPRFFGGFKLKTESGEQVRFLSLLENNYKVVEYLREHQPQLSDCKKFDKYIQTSQLVGLSWKRIMNRLKKWPLLVFKFLIFPAMFFFYLQSKMNFGDSTGFKSFERTAVVVTIFILMNFMVSLFFNHFEEMILNNKAEDKTKKELRDWDFEQEKLIYYMTQIFFFVSSGLLLFFLVQVGLKLFA